MSEKKASPISGITTSSTSSTPTLTSSPIPQQPAPPPPPPPQATQVPQVQVIQPLHSSPYLQHLYNTPPPQLMLHGNLAIQPGAMAQLQGITHNLSLQLTHNKASPKSPTLISANNNNSTKSPNLTNTVVTSKASGIGPMQAAQMIATATSGKNVIHGQPMNRVPATSHQPLVINQLITTAPSLLTTQLDSHLQNEAQAKQRYDVWNLQLDSHLQTEAQAKQRFDVWNLQLDSHLQNEAQAKQRYEVWNLQPAKHDHNKPLGQQTLQPKSAMMPAHVQPTSQAQVISGAQFVHSKQMSSQPQLVACQPQIITSQPAMLTSQAQVINHFQAMAALPQNISWAHASLQSPTTLLTTQTPIFIRSQQQDVFIQSQPTFQTQATATAQPIPTKVKQAVELPTKLVTKQSVGTGTKSVPAILPLHPNQSKTPTTQTWTSVTPSVVSKPASKPRAKSQTSRSVQVTSGHPKNSHQAKVFPATSTTSTIIAKVPPEMKSTPPPKEPEMPVLEMAPTAAIIAAASQMNHTKVDSPPPKELPCTNGMLETKPCENPPSFVDHEIKKMEEDRPEAESVKVEKPQPQKAIVKPQILTHVIEGYVIQEGPEPFPFEKVNRSSLLTEFIPPKMTQAEKDLEEGKEQGQEKHVYLSQKFPKNVSTISPLDMAKCEFCGKMDIKDRFKRSKRFCTTTCAKRYNVGCSKRVGLFIPTEPRKSNLIKKKRHSIKMRRCWKKEPRPPFLPDDKSQSPDMKEDEEEESSSTPESQEDCPMSAEPPALQPMECETMEVERSEPEKVPPTKWTVNDVSEFIRTLPGCKDYAEEFRNQEIDGQALMLLKEDHLMSAMNMKLGPALKICARINTLKEECM